MMAERSSTGALEMAILEADVAGDAAALEVQHAGDPSRR